MKSDEAVYAEMERGNTTACSSSDTTAITSSNNNNSRFMIASEAPILLGKACQMLVKELTIRSWRHTERNRRRTLQKQDVHAAVGESEVYDFLIDIVPRAPLQGKSLIPEATTTIPSSTVSTGASSDAQSLNPLEHVMVNQQAQQGSNVAQVHMQYNMMFQQQQMQADSANPTGTVDASAVNQQIPQQMMMYMPTIPWQTQAMQQQQQQQPTVSLMHNLEQDHLNIQDINSNTQKS